MNERPTVTPYRYVVLVWFYDHWSVNVASDSVEWAEETAGKAAERFPVLLIDTEAGGARIIGRLEPKHIEAVVTDRVPDESQEVAARVAAIDEPVTAEVYAARYGYSSGRAGDILRQAFRAGVLWRTRHQHGTPYVYSRPPEAVRP